jgi:hypothetical protein
METCPNVWVADPTLRIKQSFTKDEAMTMWQKYVPYEANREKMWKEFTKDWKGRGYELLLFMRDPYWTNPTDFMNYMCSFLVDEVFANEWKERQNK